MNKLLMNTIRDVLQLNLDYTTYQNVFLKDIKNKYNYLGGDEIAYILNVDMVFIKYRWAEFDTFINPNFFIKIQHYGVPSKLGFYYEGWVVTAYSENKTRHIKFIDYDSDCNDINFKFISKLDLPQDLSLKTHNHMINTILNTKNACDKFEILLRADLVKDY